MGIEVVKGFLKVDELDKRRTRQGDRYRIHTEKIHTK